jgi:hypothetical protein
LIASAEPLEEPGLVSVDVTVLVHGTPHTPPWHVSLDEQGTAAPHWPQASHVCTLVPEVPHCVVPGVQTGA